jgi:hypothetical protein
MSATTSERGFTEFTAEQYLLSQTAALGTNPVSSALLLSN